MAGPTTTQRPLRWGMVGGGPGSNIGDTHRLAATMDGHFALVTGVFARDAERSRAFAAHLGVPDGRRYATWSEMADAEASRSDGIEVVSVVTPNSSHHEIARAFAQRGIAVVCDKPLTTDLADALDLVDLQHDSGTVMAVSYNYSGYPLVRHARDMVRDGAVGRIRLVQVEHASGWAATLLEAEGHKQASWRTDPAEVGRSAVLSDLGTHAHHLVRFITGLEVEQVCADISTLVDGRRSDDNAHVLLRLSGGVPGVLWVSMAATGHLNGLRIRVYGDLAGLEWNQEQPDDLLVRPVDGPRQLLSRGAPGLSPSARRASRLWPGHPEGFLEAFANVYADVADAVTAKRDGREVEPAASPPTMTDGALGVRFVEAAASSAERHGAWVDARLGGPERSR